MRKTILGLDDDTTDVAAAVSELVSSFQLASWQR